MHSIAKSGKALMPALLTRCLSLIGMLVVAATAWSKPANRVISLTPHITELIYAAGAGNKLVATVTSSDYPPAARAMPRVGDGLSVNMEGLLAMDPDLVVAWNPNGIAQTLAPTLERLGIALMYSHPRLLSDIPGDIRRLGKSLGTSATANTAAQGLEDRLDVLRLHYSGLAPVTVFIEVGSSPLYTLGNDALINDAVRTCGGVNVYADLPLAAPLISAEDVLAKRPDVVIIGSLDPTYVDSRQRAWRTLKLGAALDKHLYPINPDALFRPGPRLIDATADLCRYLDTVRHHSK